MAACHEYHQQRRHVPDGFSDSEYPEQDSAALQVKIDELIRATSSRQDLIGIEEMSGPELDSKRREVRMED
jgi:hypothetical protein